VSAIARSAIAKVCNSEYRTVQVVMCAMAHHRYGGPT